jgi:hypothetical protein
VDGRVEHYHYALLPLDVAFMQRDRLLPAVKYDAHSFAAVGYAHYDAGVSLGLRVSPKAESCIRMPGLNSRPSWSRIRPQSANSASAISITVSALSQVAIATAHLSMPQDSGPLRLLF